MRDKTQELRLFLNPKCQSFTWEQKYEPWIPSLMQVGHWSLASLEQPSVSHSRVSTVAMLLLLSVRGERESESCCCLYRCSHPRSEGGTPTPPCASCQKKKCVLIYFNLLQPKLLTTFCNCKVSSNISSPTTKIVSQEAKVSHTNTGMEFSVWVEPQRPNVTQLRSKPSVITPP